MSFKQMFEMSNNRLKQFRAASGKDKGRWGRHGGEPPAPGGRGQTSVAIG